MFGAVLFIAAVLPAAVGEPATRNQFDLLCSNPATGRVSHYSLDISEKRAVLRASPSIVGILDITRATDREIKLKNKDIYDIVIDRYNGNYLYTVYSNGQPLYQHYGRCEVGTFTPFPPPKF